MRLSRGSVGALTAALLIAFAMWPATQAVRGPDQVVAQEKPKAKTPLVGASGSRHAGNKPKASSKTLPSASLRAVVTIVMSIPRVASILSYSISGKISCSVTPKV